MLHVNKYSWICTKCYFLIGIHAACPSVVQGSGCACLQCETSIRAWQQLYFGQKLFSATSDNCECIIGNL